MPKPAGELGKLFPGINFFYLGELDKYSMSASLGELDRVVENTVDKHALIMKVIGVIKKAPVYNVLCGHLETRLSNQAKEYTANIELLEKKLASTEKQVNDLTQYKHYYDLTIKMKSMSGVD